MNNHELQQKAVFMGAIPTELDIVNIICCRFGGGEVYLPIGKDPKILKHAIMHGYVSVHGYLTSKGRKLISSYGLY